MSLGLKDSSRRYLCMGKTAWCVATQVKSQKMPPPKKRLNFSKGNPTTYIVTSPPPHIAAIVTRILDHLLDSCLLSSCSASFKNSCGLAFFYFASHQRGPKALALEVVRARKPCRQGEGPPEYSRKMLGLSIQGIQAEYSVGSENKYLSKVDKNNLHKK